MKKALLFVVILLVLVTVGMPYVVGVMAETETEKVVININEKINDHGFFEVLSYERKYRETRSSFKLHIDDFFETELDIEYSCEGKHGVISYKYDCVINSYGDLQEPVDEHLDGEELVALSGETVLGGTLKHRFVIQSFNKFKDEQKISFEGGEIDLATTGDFKSLKINGAIGALKLVLEDEKIAFDSIGVNGEFYDAGDNLDFGRLELNASNLNYITAYQSKLLTSDFMFQSALIENGENIKFNIDLKAKDLFFKDKTSEVDSDHDDEVNEHDLESIDLNFTVRRINRKALVKLDRLIKQISAANLASEELDLGPVMSFFPIVESFLTKGFGFSLSVDAKDKTEKFKTNFDLELNDRLSFVELSSVFYSPETILEKINLVSKMYFPDSFTEKDTEFLNSIASSPFYERVDNGYKSDFSIKSGKVKVNGQSRSIEEFVQEVLEQADF